MKEIIALLLLSFVYSAASTPCLEFIERQYERQLKDDYQNLTQEESYFIDFSGKNEYFPEFGNRPACDEAPEMNYFFAIRTWRQFAHNTFASVGFAACLPVSCTSVPGLSSNQTFITRLFLARKWGLSADSDYERFYRLEDPNNWDKPILYYPSLVLFSLFTLAAVISTIYLYKQGNEDPRSPTSHLQGMIKAFDLKTNALQLYQTAKEQKVSDDLAVFQFLRMLSAYWVVLFHTFLFNLIFCYGWQEDPSYKAWKASPIDGIIAADSVNNFFFIGGFFAVYAMVSKLAAAPFGFKAFLEQLKHRILRIWPVYMILLLLYSQVGPFIWSKPAMYLYQNEDYPCHRPLEILAKAFFLDGILNRFLSPNTAGLCWGSTWYISTEFHIYWFAIIVVGIYAKWRRSGRALIIALIVQSIALAQRNYLVYDYFRGDYFPLWEAKHIRTPCTIWYTFFHGALWGSFYYEYSKMNRKNIFTIFEKYRIVSYITMAIGLAFFIEVRHPFIFNWAKLPFVWLINRHLVYDTGIALMFMPLIAKRQYWIKTIMNWRFFQIAGKTSFNVYLVHDFVFRSVLFSTMKFRTFSAEGFFMYALINICIAQILGFWVHLCIEKPLFNIEMHFTKKKKPLEVKTRDQVRFIELKDESSDNELKGNNA